MAEDIVLNPYHMVHLRIFFQNVENLVLSPEGLFLNELVCST